VEIICIGHSKSYSSIQASHLTLQIVFALMGESPTTLGNPWWIGIWNTNSSSHTSAQLIASTC